MKKILALLLALVLVLGLAACGGKTETPKTDTSNPGTPSIGSSDLPSGTNNNKTASDETLVVAHKGNPIGLFPLIVPAVSANGPVIEPLYDTLVKYDYATGSVLPCLATSWEMIDDTHMRLTLRDDVYSHAGDHFTANDVLYTIRTGLDTGMLAYYYKGVDVANTKVEDDTHIVLAFTEPNPDFLLNATCNCAGMIVEASVKANGGEDGQSRNPVAGTGPYKFVEWAEGSYVKLTRNDKYWGDQTAYFKDIEFRIITDASARVLNLESGDVQVAMEPDTTALMSLQGNDKVQIANLEVSRNHILWLNMEKAPFDDVNVRKAIALAINYDANLAIALNNLGVHSESLWSPRMQGYVSPAEGGYESYFHYDVEAAKAALAASAYPDGFSFELQFYEDPNYSSYAEAMRNQLAQIGIDMKLAPTASAVFWDNLASGNFDAHLLSSSSPSPTSALELFDGRIPWEIVQGGAGWRNPPEGFYDLVDTGYTATDEAVRNKAIADVQKIINEECIGISLYNSNQLIGIAADVKGVTVDSYGSAIVTYAYKE